MSLPASAHSARLTIDLAALAANHAAIARRAGPARIAPAMKADGYGLGAAPMLARLVAEGCADVFVASWSEAAALAPRTPATVHVLHGFIADDLACAKALPCVVPVLNSPDQAALWRAAVPGRVCDLMVDTGINRLGFAPADLGAAEGLPVDMLMSHLACADEPGHPLNARQLAAFAAIDWPHRRRSLANSAGVYLGRAYAFDVVRPGVALYGGAPCADATDLAQVARIEARILQLRDVPPGNTVGYGATFTADRPTRLAIVGIGYADGLPRAPGGVARLDGGEHPCVGRVSMDLTAIDVTDARDAQVGDWVELAFDLPRAAAAAGRSQYELLTGLGDRFARRYLGA